MPLRVSMILLLDYMTDDRLNRFSELVVARIIEVDVLIINWGKKCINELVISPCKSNMRGKRNY